LLRTSERHDRLSSKLQNLSSLVLKSKVKEFSQKIAALEERHAALGSFLVLAACMSCSPSSALPQPISTKPWSLHSRRQTKTMQSFENGGRGCTLPGCRPADGASAVLCHIWYRHKYGQSDLL
jgi:hypothetical protein